MKPVDLGGSTFAWLETSYGRMLSLNPQCHHEQYETNTYQPYITSLLESNQYDTFIDCGAYIGIFTMVGASHCKQVIAYEASPFVYGILLFNMRFRMNVHCQYAWVGNHSQIPTSKLEDIQMVTSQRTEKYNIPIVELDEELLPLEFNKMLIKIDIEGSELEALKACKELIKLPHIDWVIDVHFQHGIKREDVLVSFKNKIIYSIQDVLVILNQENPLFKNWEMIKV